jgi:anti-sigma factor RsiW
MIRPDCPEQSLLLSATGDGLDAAKRSELERHLDHCPHCRQELAALKIIHAALPATDWHCSPQETARFAARVSRAVQRPSARRIIWQAPLAAATIAGIALFLMPIPTQQPVDNDLSTAPRMELAILADQDLLENLDLLQQLDLLEGLEESG